MASLVKAASSKKKTEPVMLATFVGTHYIKLLLQAKAFGGKLAKPSIKPVSFLYDKTLMPKDLCSFVAKWQGPPLKFALYALFATLLLLLLLLLYVATWIR